MEDLQAPAPEWKPSLWEWLHYRLMYWVVLPFRAWQVRIRQWGEGRQRCKVCGVADGFNFTVPDSVWEAVVPLKFQCGVVCLHCFDHFAKQREVDYSTSLSGFCFAGDKASLGFEISHAVNIKDRD